MLKSLFSMSNDVISNHLKDFLNNLTPVEMLLNVKELTNRKPSKVGYNL